MFQKFARALFGDEELSRCSGPGDRKEEEDEEDWILVNYLAEACSGQRGDGSSSSGAPEEEEEEEEDDDLVMVPSPRASPTFRYASCTSLNSTADTDQDGGAEEEEGEGEGGFLRLDACSLEESWFVTPPPCFTGRSSQHVLPETSPLENLLIEHPSMSVYTHHSPPRLAIDPRPRSLDRELDFLSVPPAASGGREKARRSLDSARHRPEVAIVQRRSSLHSACYVAALSARSSLVQQRPGNATKRTQLLSRNALRRLNLQRPPKASSAQLHQPCPRHLNF